MSSNNVTTAFSAEKTDFLPVSGRNRSNFYAHLIPRYFIKRLLHSIYEKISEANVDQRNLK